MAITTPPQRSEQASGRRSIVWRALAVLTLVAAWLVAVRMVNDLAYWHAVFPGAGYDRKVGLIVGCALLLTLAQGLALVLSRPRSAVIGTWLGTGVAYVFYRIVVGYLQPSPISSLSSDALVTITIVPIPVGAWLGLYWSRLFGR